MKRLIFFICLVLSIAGYAQEKRLALVIGNSDYEFGGSLKNPVNDANLMATTLEELGFDVIKKTNVNKQVLESSILDFWRKQADYNISLFYYAGHGVQVDGVNYILPVDIKLEDQLALRIEAIDMGEVVSQFERFPNNINLVILDACRDDPFRSWVRGNSAGFAAMPAPSGTLIAFATSPGATASDGQGANGLFTEHLTRQMKIPQRIEDVFINTRVAVRQVSGGKQNPQEWSQLVGQFMFAQPEIITVKKPEIGDVEAAIAYGTIELTTEISGQLYLDGELLSNVNANTKIPINSVSSGLHTLAIMGDENWAERITIYPNQISRINAKKNQPNAVAAIEKPRTQDDPKEADTSRVDKDTEQIEKGPDVENQKTKSGTLFGIYLGIGLNANPKFKGSGGADFLTPISDRYAIGAFASFQTMKSVSFGVNMLIGDYHNKRAFFYGAGMNLASSRFFVLNRLGLRSSQKRFYWFVELGFGNGGGGFIGSANFGISL